MVRQWSLPNYFASETKNFAALLFFLGHAIKNSSGQMRQISRRMEMIHPTIGWRRDEHGTQKHAHDSWSLWSVSLVRSKTMYSLSCMVALHYPMLHRFKIFSAPGTIPHGSIRLLPRSLASSQGCSLVINNSIRTGTPHTYSEETEYGHWGVIESVCTWCPY